MSSFWYTRAKRNMAKGDIDFDTVDIRALLVMTNTTADTETDKTSLAGFTTLDEYNGSGYSRPDIGGLAVNEDTGNARAEIDVSDFTFGSAGAGTRSAQGMVIYVRVDGTAANDYPVAFIDSGGFPFAGAGGPINVVVDAEGLLQVS